MKQKVVALLTAAVLAAGGGIVGGLDVQAAQWHQDGYGWWLQEDGGAGYAVNGWRQVDGSWYYFDGSGYMLTGWQNLGGTWYYMYDNGVMATNTWIGGYYVGADGCWVSDDSALKEQEVWALVNEARAANGLEALQYDYTLAEAAGKRAEELVSNLSHNRPDGSVCFTVLEEYGIRYWMAGENIAAGQTSAESVMNGWLNSPGHYMNIMGDYSHIGVGHYTDAYGTEYWVQLFITK